MTRGEAPAMREALEHVLESTNLLFDTLLEPFETLAETHPDAPIGAPIDAPYIPRTSAVREAAEQVTRGGRGGWSLYQVDERENQIKGSCGTTDGASTARPRRRSGWTGSVAFRDAVLADVNTALQAPRGWDRLDLSNRSARNGKSGGEDLLTPKDVAPELKLGERTVRRTILEGKLGPWRKEGSRWVIQRDAFWKYWSGQYLDSDVPQPPARSHTRGARRAALARAARPEAADQPRLRLARSRSPALKAGRKTCASRPGAAPAACACEGWPRPGSASGTPRAASRARPGCSARPRWEGRASCTGPRGPANTGTMASVRGGAWSSRFVPLRGRKTQTVGIAPRSVSQSMAAMLLAGGSRPAMISPLTTHGSIVKPVGANAVQVAMACR